MLDNAFIISIVTTMEDILRKHGSAVIVCDCRRDPQREKEAVHFFIHKRVNGLIHMNCHRPAGRAAHPFHDD